MIYIDDIHDPVMVMVPRTLGVTEPREARLRLTGTVSLKTVDIPVLDIRTHGDCYALTGDFSRAEDPGEYEYRLTDRDGLLASGVLVVEDRPASGPVQYNKEVTYEQYQAQR